MLAISTIHKRIALNRLAGFLLLPLLSVLGSCNSGAEPCAPSDPFCKPELMAAYLGMLPGPPGPVITKKYTADKAVLLGASGFHGFSLNKDTGAVEQDLGIVLGATNISDFTFNKDGTHMILWHSYSTDTTISKTIFDYVVNDDGTMQPAGGIYATGETGQLALYTPEDDQDQGVIATAGSVEAGLQMYDWASGNVSIRSDSALGPQCNVIPLFSSDGGKLYGIGSTFGAYVAYYTRGEDGQYTYSGEAPETYSTTRKVSATISPDDRDLYFVHDELITAYQYSLDDSTGAPTYQGSYGTFGTVNSYVIDSAMHPTGNFLYFSIAAHDQIQGMVRDPNTGSLTPISGFPMGTMNGPDQIEMDPAGNFILVTGGDGLGNQLLAVYTIAEDGSLTEVSGSPYAVSENTWRLKIINDYHYVQE